MSWSGTLVEIDVEEYSQDGYSCVVRLLVRNLGFYFSNTVESDAEFRFNEKSDIQFYTIEDRDLVIARNLSKLQRKEIERLCIHTYEKEIELEVKLDGRK